MSEDVARLLHEAVNASEPYVELRSAVTGMVRAGTDREAVRLSLEQLRLEVRMMDKPDSDRERLEDIILDVLDELTGWTSPHLRI